MVGLAVLVRAWSYVLLFKMIGLLEVSVRVRCLGMGILVLVVVL